MYDDQQYDCRRSGRYVLMLFEEEKIDRDTERDICRVRETGREGQRDERNKRSRVITCKL